MFRMAVGHSDDIDPAVALSQVFAGCDAGLAGARPRAGLLFATFDADHQALVAAVREHYPDIELCGSSAAGEMSSVGGFQEDSIALALFATDDVDVVAGLGTGVLVDPRAAAIQAVADARARSAQEPRLCLALTASTGDDPGAILAYLREALGPDVAVLGGGAANPRPSSAI